MGYILHYATPAGSAVDARLEEIVGKTLAAVVLDTEHVLLSFSDGSRYVMFHDQECCEDVGVEDVVGDLNRLVGQVIVEAREDTSGENPADVPPREDQDSFTWTFYTLRTNLDTVTIRWYGESNGYYSEAADFARLEG